MSHICNLKFPKTYVFKKRKKEHEFIIKTILLELIYLKYDHFNMKALNEIVVHLSSGVFGDRCVFPSCSTGQFALITFQVWRSHAWQGCHRTAATASHRTADFEAKLFFLREFPTFNR